MLVEINQVEMLIEINQVSPCQQKPTRKGQVRADTACLMQRHAIFVSTVEFMSDQI